jgi:cell division protein FtsL
MTRGRAWIAVLAVLLVGIVALNVATLSFAASSGKIDEQITSLEQEISMLESREAKYFSTARIRNEGAAAGLAMPTTEEPTVVEFEPADVATAAARLAAAGG